MSGSGDCVWDRGVGVASPPDRLRYISSRFSEVSRQTSDHTPLTPSLLYVRARVCLKDLEFNARELPLPLQSHHYLNPVPLLIAPCLCLILPLTAQRHAMAP